MHKLTRREFSVALGSTVVGSALGTRSAAKRRSAGRLDARGSPRCHPVVHAWHSFWLFAAPAFVLSCSANDEPQLTWDPQGVCQQSCSGIKAECGWVDADVRTCEERCSRRFASYPSACQQSANDALECRYNATTWYCPEARPVECDTKQATYEACVAREAPADATAHCGKCRSCFEAQPDFADDFCGRYWDGAMFATTPCRTEFDIMDLRVR